MVHVFLTRHGETEENAAGILQGQLPGHLSVLGREQAIVLGDKLKDIKADAVICSDLQRCIDTTRIAIGEDVKPVIEPLLRERDWGRYTGKPIRQALVDGVNEEDNEEGAPESVEDMFQRAVQLTGKWLQEYNGKTIIAVGHGLFDRILIAANEGKTIREVPRMENAEVRELYIDHVPTPSFTTEEIKATAN